MTNDESLFWTFRDEGFYECLKTRYSDRVKLCSDADEKKKILEKTNATDPMFQRTFVASELADLRLDMAYILDKNTQLQQYIETIGFLHQRVDLLEGAYGHMKMMAESVRHKTSMENMIEKIRNGKANEQSPT